MSALIQKLGKKISSFSAGGASCRELIIVSLSEPANMKSGTKSKSI